MLASASIWILSADRTDAKLATTAVQPDGTFCSAGLPAGSYVVSMPQGISPWHVRSVSRGGREETGAAIKIDDKPITDVIVALADRPTTLDGTVRDPRGALTVGAAVRLFPQDDRQWQDFGPLPVRLREARTTYEGRFRFERLIAGTYFVVALPPGASRAWMSSGELRRLAVGATKIEIRQGQASTLDLVVR
jgi:hypothetical protein